MGFVRQKDSLAEGIVSQKEKDNMGNAWGDWYTLGSWAWGPFVKGFERRMNEYVICWPRKSSNVGQGVTTVRVQIDLIG